MPGGVINPVNWLFLTIGIFFAVVYFVPFGGDLYSWSFLNVATAVGVLFLYLLVMGIALPLVSNLVVGLPREITLLAMGGMGLILTMAAGSMGGGTTASGVFGVLGMLGLVAAIVGNELRGEYPQFMLGRLMGGIGGGVYILFGLLGMLLKYTQIGFPRGTTMTVIDEILEILATLTIVAGCILLLVNLKDSPNWQNLSKTARLLILIGVLVHLAIPLIGPPIDVLMAGTFSGAIWTFLAGLRLEGYLLGLMLVVGVSLYMMLKRLVYGAR